VIIGYARVSTVAQDHADQVAELKAAGCDLVFAEAKSGQAGSKRPQLARAMASLQAGDQLVVTRLSRLARSAGDALQLLAATHDRGATFRSLREPWADTSTPAGRLITTIWSGLAEFDREMILERTREGRQSAKGRGVRMGRPPTLTARQQAWVRQERRAGRLVAELAALLNVSRNTIKRVKPDPAEESAYDVAYPNAAVDIEELIRVEKARVLDQSS
jgi:DNA invertase Pin-like site-specific DNA recombinase